VEADPPPQPEGRVAGLFHAVKGLTFTNALVIIMLGIVAIPIYFAWRVLNDEELLDRFFSSYRELASANAGCAVRQAKFRGGAPLWTVSTGFAYQGSDRYIITVVLDHQPDNEEITSFCATLKLLADDMLGPS
jgi:hypothetical protein